MNFHTKNSNAIKKENAEKFIKDRRNDLNNYQGNFVPNNEISSVKSERIRNRLDQSISNESKKKILNLLDEVGQLSDLEKLFLYVQLPTGSTPNIDVTRQRYLSNPLGKKGDIEVAQTYTWIQSHLEEDPDISLPKHEVYEEYRNYFEANKLDPLCAADFGKVMKHVFPSVKPRRLGTRGNSRYCYSGLKKKVNIKPPSLQDFNIGEDLYDNSNKTESNEVNEAACHIIFEWAEKLLSKKFSSIKELAKHLVENFYIGKPSVTALSLLSVPSTKNRDTGSASNTFNKKRKQNPLQCQKKIQECNKGQKRKNKLQCIHDTCLKMGMTENGICSNTQLTNVQELNVLNTQKIMSTDTQNITPIEPVNNSQSSSVMPVTSQALLTVTKQLSNNLNGSNASHFSISTNDDVKNENINNNYNISKEKCIQKYQRSKSVEFKKLDYESAIYNLFNQCDNLGNESLSIHKKEYFKHDLSMELNTKRPRMNEFASNFNSIAISSACDSKSPNNISQISTAEAESSSSKINSLDTYIESESLNLQHSTNSANEKKIIDSSQLRMLLEKDFTIPVNQSKLEGNKAPGLIPEQENQKNVQDFQLNKPELNKFPLPNTGDQWKKDNFHSTKLSLLAETYNRSLKQSEYIQELNNDKIQPDSVLSLSSNNSTLTKLLIPENNISNINQISNTMSPQKSFNLMPVSIKQDDRKHNFNVSNQLQMPCENFKSVMSNNQETLIPILNDSHENYSSPKSPFLFPQQASTSVSRLRHHSSHNLGQVRNYNSYPFGSRSRHFSGPTYSKHDKSLEMYNFGSDPALGNRTSRVHSSFSPVHTLDLPPNLICVQEMQNKIPESFTESVSQELNTGNPNIICQLNNAESMEANMNQNSSLMASSQTFKTELTDDFSQNMQYFHPIRQSGLSENRCQSVPPHKMLQMLIDQSSPINSPVISKSYPTTPVVNQIFHFPVSQPYQYESDMSQMEPSKLLSQSTQQNMSEVLMGGWNSSDEVCHTSMTELLEQPLDDLQTTLDDLKECDEFSKFA
ncbi:MATH and LRR domain-containing protein PFE0570w-like [Centruroides vittatus]|uniref:MATH and LRR domain-containing protein PFE0570w-like n=1 Tax=Centruroides vittatus TaxID=120091 RepID=UPI003510ADFB